jgi:hypothetical protein
MSMFVCDPFFNFLQKTSAPVGSVEYIDGLINRLEIDCKPNGLCIETDDAAAFSEATDLMIYHLNDQAKDAMVDDPMHSEALHQKAAMLHSLAVRTGLLDQDGWMHKLMGREIHNPLLCEKFFCSSLNYGVAA